MQVSAERSKTGKSVNIKKNVKRNSQNIKFYLKRGGGEYHMKNSQGTKTKTRLCERDAKDRGSWRTDVEEWGGGRRGRKSDEEEN